MNVLLLAAGYATRLRPLSDRWAKELLPVGGRPIIDWILDRVLEVEGVEGIYVVTNAKKAPAFSAWAKGKGGGVTVVDDGTSSNEDRLGAIGDMQLAVDRMGIEGDLLVIAGDNLFEFSLADFVAFWHERGIASAVAVRDVGSRELASQYGIVSLDPSGRVLDFVEKPADPASTLAATATYLFHREHVPLLRTYLDEGESPDQPGRFVAWLQAREPVYGWPFEATWYDVGNFEQLLEADNRLRLQRDLPARDVYDPEG